MASILCVEDNDDNLFMLQRRLTRAGFEVKIATNGAHAVEWAKTLLPDLIVMDLNLPGLNGWEATRQLKNQPARGRSACSTGGSASYRALFSHRACWPIGSTGEPGDA